jgi:hypothetical protein
MAERIFHFAPRDAAEAARIFEACTRLRSGGRPVRAAILESPPDWARGLSLPHASVSLDELESLCPGAGADVIVSHAAMAGIEEISKADYLAVVGGGARFGDFLDAVSRAGLRFPHEPDVGTRGMTIAELLMAGTRFPADERFGRLREWVLSLELAIPKGEVIRTGSRAVKDVTGYDIAGFVIGSGGRCGVIARMTLRLLPLSLVRETSGGAFGGEAPGASAGGGDFGAGAPDAPATKDPRSRAVLDEIRERVFKVFDPGGIMSP